MDQFALSSPLPATFALCDSSLSMSSFVLLKSVGIVPACETEKYNAAQ
jgi:hypothetical protein